MVSPPLLLIQCSLVVRWLIGLDRLGTTHWPNAVHVGTNVAMRDGKPSPESRDRPVQEPVLNERTFKLTGIPYIKQEA